MDYSKLSKEVAYALRHAPWEYGLELDAEAGLILISCYPLYMSVKNGRK